MKRLLGIIAIAAVIGGGAVAFAFGQGAGRADAPAGEMMGAGGMEGGGQMHGMSGMMGMHADGHSAERPWLNLALQNREQLGLSADQVKTIEAIRSEFQKEATRRSAEIEIAESELSELLRAEPVDLAKVEVKLRRIEGLRTDLRLGRIKALEQGKATLTPEQRKKLEPLSSAGAPGGMAGMRGMDEMHRFMQSERMPQAMSAMMEMARQMGNGDAMAGMVRMMEMMSMMGQMGGMMGPAQPQPSK